MNFRTIATFIVCVAVTAPALADDLQPLFGTADEKGEIRVVDTNDDIVSLELPSPAETSSDVAAGGEMTEDSGTASKSQADQWIGGLDASSRPTHTDNGQTETNNVVVPLPAPVAIAAIGLLGLAVGRKKLRTITG